MFDTEEIATPNQIKMGQKENENTSVFGSIEEELTATGSSEFTVSSGNLIVVDPYYLGFSEEINMRIDELKYTTNLENRFVALPHGVICSTSSDMTINVYKEKDGRVVVVAHDADPREGEGAIFSTGVDVALILIGDAEAFRDAKDYGNYTDNIIMVPNGLYTFDCESEEGIMAKVSVKPKD